MKIKNVKLEWNVLLFDFNKQKIVPYNIFSTFTSQDIADRIKRDNITDYNSLKESIEIMFRAVFWSRVEYEVLVNGIHSKVEPFKIDVWEQIKINLDRILEYIINEMDIKIK